MAETPAGKLVVILHADVVGSTALVQRDERRAHERITSAFQRFSLAIQEYGGHVHEIRGDALVAEFARASDAVCASLAFQGENAVHNKTLEDEVAPEVRIGISLGEVIVADNTVTGAGVVLAQRLEQLAEPGGMCLQGAAYETVPRRLPFAYLSLGEQSLKGFEEPVRAYAATLKPGEEIPPPEPRVKPSQTEPLRIVGGFIGLIILVAGVLAWWQNWIPSSVERTVTERASDQPSIVVLPFTNMSDDTEQEHFADGMTDDLITDLSKISGMFVIARHTSFSYKGKILKVPEVARELGVRYVLEGSVRHAGGRIRVNAQLINAATGGHLWAERYDGDGEDVFLLQDQVIENIATALEVTLTDTERTLIARIPTRNLEAYDYFQRAKRAGNLWGSENRQLALSLYQKAIELDPEFAEAYAGFARAAREILQWGLVILPAPVARKLAYEAASKALTLDPNNAQAHAVLARLQLVDGEHELAIESARTAVSLHPNNPEIISALAAVLVYAGEHAEALAVMNTALRLEQNPPPLFHGIFGFVLFWNRQYDKAIEHLEKALDGGVEYYPILAMAYTQLGRTGEAREMVERILASNPAANLAFVRVAYATYKRAEDLEHHVEILGQAGIPEWPFGFQGRAADRLNGAEIEPITFGRSWRGHDVHSGGAIAQEIDKKGNVAFSGTNALLTGTARVDGDTLCLRFPSLLLGQENCSFLFRNPHGTADEQNEYVLVSSHSIFNFSVEP